MRILLLSQYFPPETGSAAAKMAELADYLANRGHAVSVVSQMPSYPDGIVYPEYRGTWFRRENQNGVRITRTWSYASSERGKFGPRFGNYASFMATGLGGILAGPRPDSVLVYSPPLFLGLTALMAKKILGSPFIFWVNDLWPRAALHLGYMKPGSLYGLACRLERLIYQEATQILVYSHRMGKEVAANGANPEKIVCHPLWIDTEVFRPAPDHGQAVRRQHGWEDKFVVLYGGNLGLAQGLDVFLETAKALREVPEVHFVLVGSGIEKSKLMEQVREQGLTNVEFVDHQPKEKVIAYFAAADVLFAHLKAAPHRVGTVPEKVLAYMACGRPVLLAAQEGAAADLIREHHCGLAIPPENAVLLAEAILDLAKDHGQLQRMGAIGRTACEEHFAGPLVLEAMEASLRRIAR